MQHETQRSISDWATEAFGAEGTLARIATRANEEMAELLTAATGDAENDVLMEEIADVVIVLMRFAERLDTDLQMAVDVKMSVNRRRNWQPDGTGHGYHTHQATPTPEPGND